MILESRVICKQVGRYLAWPTIAATPAGELLVVFSGDRDAHVCPLGKTFLMRSTDNGQTWSAPVIITNTPLDDRDAGLCVCPDGTIIVTWFTYWKRQWPERWPDHMRNVSAQDVANWSSPGLIDGENHRRGHWLRRSTDGGRTWEPPLRVPPTAPHGPIVCTAGRLLYVGNDAYDRAGKTSSIIAAESRDQGQTWQVIGRTGMFPTAQGYLCEPHVVEVSPGRLVAMARYEERPKTQEDQNAFLWQFDSTDGGRTWTAPRPTEIWGKPPHLIRLRDGRLLVTYGIRHAPTGQRACLSTDGGQTWDYRHEIVLRDDAPDEDLGYPATVECADGTLVTVYYQVDKPGEPPCLMLTRWRV
ncbi:MAG: hypothetical protein PCFJNLEI_02087 [Verrucomicrobiae bacterium]|nr:hypothetical protein [Verrucomicrobiae bacterium]